MREKQKAVQEKQRLERLRLAEEREEALKVKREI